MFSRLIDLIADRIRRAVWERLSGECEAATGCEPLAMEEPAKALPGPEKRRARS